MEISPDILRTFTPFDNLNDEYINRVQGRVKLRHVAKGTLVFKRGRALPESFYLVAGHIDLIDSSFAVTSLTPDSADVRFPLGGSSPPQVSAIAKSEVKLLSVERDFLDLVMAWSQSSDFSMTGLKDQQVEVGGGEDDDDESDWMSCLLRSPLFTQIPPANIQQLFTRFESVEVKSGEPVVKEGEQGDYFYVIESGEARVQSKTGKLEAVLCAGDYFGEEALVGDTTRNATVTMDTDGVLMRLDKDTFKALLQEPLLRYIDYEALREQSDGAGAIQVLDVRLPIEHRHRHVTGARSLPLSSLRGRFTALDRQQVYVITDDAGRRSEVAAQLLCQAGFDACILKDAALHYGDEQGDEQGDDHGGDPVS
ncbi:cyclic nucleotide-binding domain-containing protein [Exilibacterium tricleocarpae]|uniref:Cyclic nucleotide-binding domain-containing protein n=1 Tax=Exilibacterium tricleocarpae TaxID=2591008 RepID=A0A545U3S9_9GAMM|nr:cyclic nucleotide-binding domain-containing protein [Exilibacterium tricleocarpae]TQV84106.1 cyclic nucleotide-binding domain-containing protein [Exilibacterium tricleocarpae]